MKADYVIYSRNIYTSSEAGVLDGMIAIQKDKIIYVGDIEQGQSYVGESTKIFQHEEQFVMPGFIDNHIHLLLSALRMYSPNISQARSEEEVVELMSNYYGSDEASEDFLWGFGWYEHFWENKELPTRQSLDKVFPNTPVILINAECHGCWTNSKALEKLGIDKDIKDFERGIIVRDKRGNPTGVFLEKAMELIMEPAVNMSREKMEKLLHDFSKYLLSIGVTSVLDVQYLCGVNAGDVNTYRHFVQNHTEKIRIHYATSFGLKDKVDSFRNEENDYLRFWGFKEFVDGVPADYSAYFLKPYADKTDTYGELACDQEILTNNLEWSYCQDIPVKLHCCGDGAVNLAINIWEQCREKHGAKDIRNTIEHVECIHPLDIKRMSKNQIVASMQPNHLGLCPRDEEETYYKRYDKNRMKYLWAVNSIAKEETRMVFGSDSPVMSINPMEELYRSIARTHDDGKPKGGWNPQEKISRCQAVDYHTNAYGIGREDKLGRIEKGMYADLIVIDRNLLTVTEEELRQAQVVMTMVSGNILYQKRMEG